MIPAGAAFHFGAGLAFGIIIGLVSSILGVAGGELLIPTMMFIFGADIKTAGTASIVISVCVVTSGLWRYWRSGAMETRLGARRIVTLSNGLCAFVAKRDFGRFKSFASAGFATRAYLDGSPELHYSECAAVAASSRLLRYRKIALRTDIA